MNARTLMRATKKLMLSRVGDGAVTCAPVDSAHDINVMKLQMEDSALATVKSKR